MAPSLRLALLLLLGTLLGLAGIDLILPAVPGLPEALGGTPVQAQGVLAAFSFGTGAGLLLFGALGAAYPARWLLPLALTLYGAFAFAAAAVTDMPTLLALRFFQGLLGACPAVLAPGLLRALFPPDQALRALAAMGSAEALAPALAPVLGAALLALGDWRTPFLALGGAALAVALLTAQAGAHLPILSAGPERLAYGELLRLPRFRALGLAYACALASLLVYVFAMPTLLTQRLGGGLSHFIGMQMAGILTFMVAANSATTLAKRFGHGRVSTFGAGLSTGALGLLCGYAALGGAKLWVYLLLFLPVNAGLGFRGPLAFFAALDAGQGNDERGSALLLLAVMVLTGGGTLLAAPTLPAGPLGLTATAFALALTGVLAGRRG